MYQEFSQKIGCDPSTWIEKNKKKKNNVMYQIFLQVHRNDQHSLLCI